MSLARDVTTVGGELDHELSPHAGAPAGDDGETSCERFHDSPLVRERGPYRRAASAGEAVVEPRRVRAVPAYRCRAARRRRR